MSKLTVKVGVMRVRDNALFPFLKSGELVEIDRHAQPMECDIVCVRTHDGAGALFEYRDIPAGLPIVGIVTGLHVSQ